MKAFARLDHLLCDVPDIEEAFTLFHDQLGFPVAWPIGRYWPQGRTCGIALGGANLEFIQNDSDPISEAVIRCVAFEPTSFVREAFEREGIPYEVFEKKEADPALLRLRGMRADDGEQLLCINFLPLDRAALPFPFFACDYEPGVKARLSFPAAIMPDGNELQEVVIGVPDPAAMTSQLERLGIDGGVSITAQKHDTPEVTKLVMKYGPLDLGGWAARFRFI